MPMAVAFLSAASAIAFAVFSVRKAFISCADVVPHWSRAVTIATMIRPFRFFETCSIRRKSPQRVEKQLGEGLRRGPRTANLFCVLCQIREDRVVHDPNRRIVVHLDGVHALVAKRLGVLDRRTQIPSRTDTRVHTAGVTREQALDRIVQLLLVVEAGFAAEVKVGVAAAPESAFPEDAPHVAESLRLGHG